jgi:hypothetical protein
MTQRISQQLLQLQPIPHGLIQLIQEMIQVQRFALSIQLNWAI